MMTTVITPANLSDLNLVSDTMEEYFPRQWGFCGDCIVLTYDEENRTELYNVWSKLEFIEFSFGMEGRDLIFENGLSVLAGMLESYEMEQIMAVA